MFLAVTCKNPKHSEENPFHGHRIKLPNGKGSPHFRVRCDSCGKTYSYESSDVLQIAE